MLGEWKLGPNPSLCGGRYGKMTLTFPFPLHIIVVDCGTPIHSFGVDIEPFNSTLFDSMVTFHCQDGLKPETVLTAVCGSRGVWDPNPAYHFCVNQSGNDNFSYMQ